MSVTSEADAQDAMRLHFARTAFSPECPARIGIAVSGGGDSMALLHLYVRLAADEGLNVSAVTVDHGVREAATEEAAFVAAYCAAHDIPHTVLRWDDWDGTGNLMAQARNARYRLIAEWARAEGVGGVVLGHTADDIAETFVMRLARKAGVDGLAAMDMRFKRHGVMWARPLWQQSRAELRGYLRRNDVPWINDPTNEEESYHRAKVRKALPVLADLGITEDVLTSVAHSMSITKWALDHYAAREARKYVTQEQGDLIFEIAPTDPLPMEMRRRLWRVMISWVSGTPYPPRHHALFEIAQGLTDDGATTLGGCLITRSGNNWRITREHEAVRELATETEDIWDQRWSFEGPHAPGLTIRALGEGIRECSDWRETGLPRASLLASPAVWRGDDLIAAPLAGLSEGWTARIVADFHEHAFAH